MNYKFITLLLFCLVANNLWSQTPPQNASLMTMNVVKDSQITLSFVSGSENTDVWVETEPGNYSHLVIGTSWTSYVPYVAADTIMNVYGNIQAFECKHNGLNITGLDVSQNPFLQTLWCNENSITHLTLNSTLISLAAMGNKLTELNVSNCPELTLLYCERNKLQTLDISANPLLQHLSFSQNNISEIDISNKPDLYGISMFGCNFDPCQIDTMFYALADRNGDFSGMIYLKNSSESNPGTEGCKTSVAVSKNWEVQDYNNGNPINITGTGTGCETLAANTQDQLELTIAPNPFRDIIYVTIPDFKTAEKVIIYDSKGSIVFEQCISESHTQLSLSQLPKGVYIIRIGSHIEKIVK